MSKDLCAYCYGSQSLVIDDGENESYFGSCPVCTKGSSTKSYNKIPHAEVMKKVMKVFNDHLKKEKKRSKRENI